MLHYRISDGTSGMNSHALKQSVRSDEERNKLWLDYQPFLIGLCKRYLKSGLDQNDLESEAQFGLRRAAELWEESWGVKFSTYAATWMLQAITRGICDNMRDVRKPIHTWEMIAKLNRAKSKLNIRFDRMATIRELSIFTGFRIKKIMWLEAVAASELSMEFEFDSGTGACLHNVLPDKSKQSGEHTADLALLRREIDTVLEQLTPQERTVVCEHNGYGAKIQTFRQIGKRHGDKSHERMRQVEGKAFKKIKYGKLGQRLRQIHKELD